MFDNIEFEFKNGKIVDAKANETKKINEILDSDEGARYCGEWAVGVNNRVRHPMLDTLFDEKIGGSFHLTPGQAYEIADNGNDSRIHWDLSAHPAARLRRWGNLVRRRAITQRRPLRARRSARPQRRPLAAPRMQPRVECREHCFNKQRSCQQTIRVRP